MTRTVRNWIKESVSGVEVAPHRYVWEGFDESFRFGKYRECMEGAPYQPGEVLYFWSGNAAVKARVMIVFARRGTDGDLREFYRVQPETVGGYWAKCWKYVYPGDVQRGYYAAGLAPEIPKSEMDWIHRQGEPGTLTLS